MAHEYGGGNDDQKGSGNHAWFHLSLELQVDDFYGSKVEEEYMFVAPRIFLLNFYF